MNKVSLLTIISLIPFNGFSSDEDGMSATDKPTGHRPPPLCFTEEYGGGLVFTGLKKNNPGEVPAPHAVTKIETKPPIEASPAVTQTIPKGPKMSPQTTNQDTKRKRLEPSNSIDSIFLYITSNPDNNLFQDASIIDCHTVACPLLNSFFTLEELFKIIQEVKDFSDPASLLPPNAADSHPVRAAVIPASLKPAEILHDELARLVPAVDEFKYFTGAGIQEDGNIFMPILNRVITMDRLIEILNTSEDGEQAMSSLSEELKDIARAAYQLKVAPPQPPAPIGEVSAQVTQSGKETNPDTRKAPRKKGRKKRH